MTAVHPQIGRADQGYTGPVRSADDQREPRIWTEVPTGRQWQGNIEKKSGDFCGLPPQPFGWTPPFIEWLPPPMFLRCGSRWTIQRPGETQASLLRTDELVIDYDGWINSLAESHRSWLEEYYALGAKMHGQAFDPAKPTPQLLAQIGPKPLAVEPVQAMRQGNRYALGLTTTVDERLREFHPFRWIPPEPDFSNGGEEFAEAGVAASSESAPTKRSHKKRPEPEEVSDG